MCLILDLLYWTASCEVVKKIQDYCDSKRTQDVKPWFDPEPCIDLSTTGDSPGVLE